MNSPVIDAAGAVAGYERLRRCVFGERVEEPGLGLLTRRGLRAWIEARVDTGANAAASAAGTGVQDSAGAGTREELMRLIAAMVIGAVTAEARP